MKGFESPTLSASPILRMLLVGILLSAPGLVLLGCGEGQANSPEVKQRVSIPFEKEGTLTFLRSDSSVVTTIDIEIADTDSAMARGLMQRDSLPDEAGMLFVYPNAAPRSFWMANTRISLDIIFVDENERIVRIAKYVRPQSSSSTRSEFPAQYVVEVNAGFADSYGLTESDRIRWERTP